MEFIDLKAQYRVLEASIQRRTRKVMESAQFIMGPEIEELEAALASRVGSGHCISCAMRKKYAAKAREILLAYADKYESYPLHDINGKPNIGGGKIGPRERLIQFAR